MNEEVLSLCPCFVPAVKMAEAVWEWAMCVDTSRRGCFEIQKCRFLSKVTKLSILTQKAENYLHTDRPRHSSLSFPPVTLQPLSSPTHPPCPWQINQEAVVQWKQLKWSLFAYLSLSLVFSTDVNFWGSRSCSYTAAPKTRLPKSGFKCLNFKNLIQVFPTPNHPWNTCKTNTI